MFMKVISSLCRMSLVAVISAFCLIPQATSEVLNLGSIRYENTDQTIIGPFPTCLSPVTEELSVNQFINIYSDYYQLTIFEHYIQFETKDLFCSAGASAKGIAVVQSGKIAGYLLLEPVSLYRYAEKQSIIEYITRQTNHSDFLPESLRASSGQPLNLYVFPEGNYIKQYLMYGENIVLYEGLIKPDLSAEIKNILFDYVTEYIQYIQNLPS